MNKVIFVKCNAVLSFFRIKNRWVHHIRNVGVVAHIDAGKTTTSEQMLFLSGETKSVGRVDDGDTVMDFLPQERERGITISSAAISFQWKEHLINLIDTPGHVDFTIEVERSARVLDGAILVIDAVAGVQAQTQTVWKQIKKQNVATIAFINKMDRDGSSYERSIQSIQTKLNTNPIPIQLPIGSEQSFHGVVDLVTMKKITWGQPREIISSRSPVPPIIEDMDVKDINYNEAIKQRGEMLERLSECNENFMEKYLNFLDSPHYDSREFNKISESKYFTTRDIYETIRTGCIHGTIIPSVCGSSLRGKGVELLLDCILSYLPSPADRSPSYILNVKNKNKKEITVMTKELIGLVFKVVYDNIRGYLVYLRIYSGTISSKQVIYNTTRQHKERVNQLVKINADDYINISEAGAGEVVCIVGLKSTYTGDTIVADKSKYESYILEGLNIPQAVYSIAIEPELSSQQTELEEALNILQIEDPSLKVEYNKESGQIVLHGIGELHIDIVIDKLNRQFHVPVSTGKAYVAYRESLRTDYILREEWCKYERIISGKRLYANIKFRIEYLSSSAEIPSSSSSLSSDVAKINTMATMNESWIDIDKETIKKLSSEEYDALLDSIRSSLFRGPKGYPIISTKITVIDIEKDIDTTAGGIRACASTYIDSIFRKEGNTEFLEPIMSVEITLPTRYMGTVLSDMSVKRRADIVEVLADPLNSGSNLNQSTKIIAFIPLATMLGYATSIRSMTQGEGQFSMEYLKHSPIDYSLAMNDVNR
jgi:elongation factor G